MRNKEDLLRRLPAVTGRQISLEGQEYLFFGGTAYLGLLNQEEFQDLHIQGMQIYGVNNGTSRNNNVQLGIYEEAEEELAQRFGMESALLLSSGYLAAQLAIKVFAKKGKVYYAPKVHPALWLTDNPKVEMEYMEWVQQTVNEINQATETDFVIVSNSLDNMNPQRYDFELFHAVSESKNLLFIIDDSHGIGIVHKNAFSVDLESFSSGSKSVLLVASLAKGLGLDAGAIFGPKALLEELKLHPIFMGASPPSPASMYALVKSQKIYEASFDRMQQNLAWISKDLPEQALFYPGFPVISFKEEKLVSFLMEHKVIIASFPYPLPTDPLLNRVVIHANHSLEDLKKLKKLLLKFYLSS